MDDETIITGPLYASRKKVYPQATHGTYRNIKWGSAGLRARRFIICCPSSAGTVGRTCPIRRCWSIMPHRRFYFFFIELWPQEVYYFTGLLIIAAMTLFLMNALAGRIWCGYLCPQTVWTDLFYAVERWVEGDRRDRIRRTRRAGPSSTSARSR